MRVIFVSGNKDKIEEAVYILSRLGIKAKGKAIRFRELENSKLENVVIDKAKQVSAVVKDPFIVDDAGIFFEGFSNFPGSFTKHIFNGLGYKGILKLINGGSRKAYFKAVIAYSEPGNGILLFKGICRGKINRAARGPASHFSPFSRLFIPQGAKKTLSEMKPHEQIVFSHRAKALKKLSHHIHKRSRKK